MIAKELTKGYDQQVIRLALDLVKLKQIDKGIDDDLDVSKYIRKAQAVLGIAMTNTDDDTLECEVLNITV